MHWKYLESISKSKDPYCVGLHSILKIYPKETQNFLKFSEWKLVHNFYPKKKIEFFSQIIRNALVLFHDLFLEMVLKHSQTSMTILEEGLVLKIVIDNKLKGYDLIIIL